MARLSESGKKKKRFQLWHLTSWKKSVQLLHLTSCEALIANSFPERDAKASVVRHQTADRQSVSPGNLGFSIKWKLNYFRLVKWSSLFSSLFVYLVCKCKMFLRMFVHVFFPVIFFPAVLSHNCIICYLNTKILFLDKERIDGKTTRGSLSISLFTFVFSGQWREWAKYKLLSQTSLLFNTSRSDFPAFYEEVIVKEKPNSQANLILFHRVETCRRHPF